MSREATSEQSSVREGSGYNKVFRSGHEPKEVFSWSSERETLAQSPNEEVESCRRKDKEGVVSEGEDEDDEREKGRESDEDENDGDEEALEGISGSPEDDHPFILPKIWTVNDFLPTMSDKVFNTLRDHYQIPDNIPICLPGKFEKCYSGKTVDVGMYDAMFAVGFRLPVMALHRQLTNFLGFSISQITPNNWRIFIGAENFVGSSKWRELSANSWQILLVLSTSTHRLLPYHGWVSILQN